MKKLVLPILALLLLATGCRKETIVEETVVYQGSYVYTEYTDVLTSHWKADNNNCYLYYTQPYSFIDKDIMDNSFVTAYFVDENNRDNGLPYMRWFVDAYSIEHPYILRYDVEQGAITFIVEPFNASDFTNLLSYLPSKLSFKVCMVKN